jgi:thermitase
MSYPDGEHKLKATAYDTQNQTSSIQITLYFDNIDNPPTINSVSVYNNQIVSGTIVVSVNCSDDKGISKVQLQIESTNYEDTSSPYQFTINTKDFSDGENVLTITVFDTIGQTTSTTRTLIFDNTPPQVSISTPVSDGTYTLRVRVYDKVLNNSYAQIKIFIDNTPPVIKSVSLYNGQIVSGTINVSVSATDNFGIKELKVYIDNNLYQKTNLTSFDINTTNFSDGEHSLKIEVYDNISNFTSTQTVVVFNNSNDQPPSCYLNFSSTNGVV